MVGSGKRQVILAILIGPLAVIPAMLLLIVVSLPFQGQLSTTPPQLLGGSFAVAIAGLLFAYGFTLFYGVPVYWLFGRRGPVKAMHILLASLLPTLIVGGLLSQSWLFSVFMAYFSVAVSYTTWLLATRTTKPAKSAPPPAR